MLQICSVQILKYFKSYILQRFTVNHAINFCFNRAQHLFVLGVAKSVVKRHWECPMFKVFKRHLERTSQSFLLSIVCSFASSALRKRRTKTGVLETNVFSLSLHLHAYILTPLLSLCYSLPFSESSPLSLSAWKLR